MKSSYHRFWPNWPIWWTWAELTLRLLADWHNLRRVFVFSKKCAQIPKKKPKVYSLKKSLHGPKIDFPLLCGKFEKTVKTWKASEICKTCPKKCEHYFLDSRKIRLMVNSPPGKFAQEKLTLGKFAPLTSRKDTRKYSVCHLFLGEHETY